MGLGAIFGAVNTMYSAVPSRTREIATLRALGFGRTPVVVSVLSRPSSSAWLAGVIGGALAWTAFDGYQTATMNWQSFSQVAFAFAVTPGLLMRGLAYSTVIGLLGGLLPAIRAAGSRSSPRCGNYKTSSVLNHDDGEADLYGRRAAVSRPSRPFAAPDPSRQTPKNKRLVANRQPVVSPAPPIRYIHCYAARVTKFLGSRWS